MHFWERDSFTYIVIAVACIAALWVMFGYNFPKPDVVEMSLTTYPPVVLQGQRAAFTLDFANPGEKVRNYTLDVYFGDDKQASYPILLQPGGVMNYTISFKNPLSTGTYRVSAKLYDATAPDTAYGSMAQPYYVYFDMKVP
jgi:hypothetical protein